MVPAIFHHPRYLAGRIVLRSDLLAHKYPAMPLECHPGQALSKNVSGLIFASYLIQLHLRVVTRGKLTNAIDARVDVLSAIVHTASLDQIYASIIVLGD